jgi:hypothetical protein
MGAVPLMAMPHTSPYGDSAGLSTAGVTSIFERRRKRGETFRGELKSVTLI